MKCLNQEGLKYLWSLIKGTFATQDELSSKASSIISGLTTTISNHANNTNNPHKITKEQVGLGNVDNTADADKTVGGALHANYATCDMNGRNISLGYAQYEEGTFTPKFWNNSNVQQTFNTVNGYYKKIGNLCYIHIYAAVFSDVSVSRIDNLPFVPDSAIHYTNKPRHNVGTVFANGKSCCVNTPDLHGQISLPSAATSILLVEGIYNI